MITQWRAVAPILAYHAIHPDRLDSVNVTPANFAAQMAWLASRGYRGVSLAGFMQAEQEKPASIRRLVALTFDDGYLDNLTHALPILQRHAFTATVFVIVNRVGTRIVHEPTLLQKHPDLPPESYGYLDWPDVLHLAQQGVEIGSHTCNHPRLDQLTRPEQQHEIEESKHILHKRCSQPVDSFSYPAAYFNDETLALVQAAGYRQAVVTPWRAGLIRGGRFTLRRVGIYRHDTLARFRFKVSPWFEWLRTLQHRLQQREQNDDLY
jgi:peptidoglycan/xylan/chitin deacetylase (PgdA/CDA1 family)